MVRPQCQRAVVALQRLFQAAELDVDVALVGDRFDIARRDRQRLAQAFQRLVVAAERHQHHGAVVVGLGEFRFQLDGAVEAFDRLSGAVERVQHQPVMHQHLRRGRAHLHGLGGVLQGLGVLALVVAEQCEILQGFDVIRPCAENPAVKLRRLVELALLVQRERLGQRLRHVERRELRQRQ